jgi:hypothetical protein
MMQRGKLRRMECILTMRCEKNYLFLDTFFNEFKFVAVGQYFNYLKYVDK